MNTKVINTLNSNQEVQNMNKIYDKMFLKNENQIKYKQLIHINESHKKMRQKKQDTSKQIDNPNDNNNISYC